MNSFVILVYSRSAFGLLHHTLAVQSVILFWSRISRNATVTGCFDSFASNHNNNGFLKIKFCGHPRKVIMDTKGPWDTGWETLLQANGLNLHENIHKIKKGMCKQISCDVTIISMWAKSMWAKERKRLLNLIHGQNKRLVKRGYKDEQKSWVWALCTIPCWWLCLLLNGRLFFVYAKETVFHLKRDFHTFFVLRKYWKVFGKSIERYIRHFCGLLFCTFNKSFPGP